MTTTPVPSPLTDDETPVDPFDLQMYLITASPAELDVDITIE